MRLAGVLLGFALMIAASAEVVLAIGVATLSESFDREAWSGGFFLFAVLIGIAFAYGVPIVGASAYAVAAAIGIIGAAMSEFDDLYIWGGLALLVSAVTFGGAYEQGKEQTRRRSRDDLAVALLNELRTLRLLLAERERQGSAAPDRDALSDERVPLQNTRAETGNLAAGVYGSHAGTWPPVVSGLVGNTSGIGSAIAPAPSSPVLSLVPERALAGELITAIGYGFRPGCNVYVAWAGSEGGARIIAQQTADPSGVVRFSFSCPHVPPGAYRVIVGAPGASQAAAILTVLATATNGAAESGLSSGNQVRT